MNHFLELYPAKVTEYLLAIGYLVLFVGFWRWVHGADAPGRERDGRPAHGRRP